MGSEVVVIVASSLALAMESVLAVFSALLAVRPRFVRLRFFVPSRELWAPEDGLTLLGRAARGTVATLRLVLPISPAAALVGALPDMDTPATAVIETRLLETVFLRVRLRVEDTTGLIVAGGKPDLALLALERRSVFLSKLCAFVVVETFQQRA